MDFMKKLLDGVKVEWRVLWEVTIWDKKFNAVDNHKQTKTIKYHHLLASELKSLISDNGTIKLITTNKTNYWTTEELAGSIINEGEIVAIPWGGNPIVQYYKGKFLTGDNRIATSNDKKYLDNKYLYYFLVNNLLLINSFYRGSGIKHPSMADVLELKIPIPPLHVQEEIVRILDTVTELTEELTEELTARKKQYNYYRDKLLTFEDGEVEWKALGEMILPTFNIKWRETKKTYKYIDLTSVCREKNIIIATTEVSAENAPSRAQKLIEKDDVIFATTRPTQQRLCLINEEFSGEIASTGYCILRAKRSKIIPKWIYYLITSSKFKNYVEDNQSGAAYPSISDAKVKEFKIPIPSISEQERIVSILDKFDTLTSSIIEGLPREIELRQKQYEYYRNKLLSFPKEGVDI